MIAKGRQGSPRIANCGAGGFGGGSSGDRDDVGRLNAWDYCPIKGRVGLRCGRVVVPPEHIGGGVAQCQCQSIDVPELGQPT